MPVFLVGIKVKGRLLMVKCLATNSKDPLYIQLADAILQAVKEGEFKGGEKIPSEEELRKLYGLSRVTVRTAIDSLVSQGILVKKQGKGTFVTVPIVESNTEHLRGFTDIFASHGYQMKKDILSMSIIPAAPDYARKLSIEPEANIIEIQRLLIADGVPAILERLYLPLEYSFVLKEDLKGSLYQILCSHGIYPTMAKKQIDICHATAEEARLLGVKAKTALFLCTDHVNDQEGKCIHVSRQIIRSDIYKLVVHSTNVELETRKKEK